MGRKLVITLLVICLVLLGLWWVDHTRQASKALPVYSGPVEGLKHTIVAPTLDEPLAAGKNVIWTAALQLAWDELREAAGGVPLKVTQGQLFADRLNSAPFDRKLLPEGSWFAWAGPPGSEEQRQANEKLAQLAPGSQPIPDLAIAFAQMNAEVPFHYAYDANPRRLKFKGGDGREVSVRNFGFKPPSSAERKGRQKYQVSILYTPVAYRGGPAEFMLDLDRESAPSQVVVAVVIPKATLRQTIDYALELEAKHDKGGGLNTLVTYEPLQVPELEFELTYSPPDLRLARFLASPLSEWSAASIDQVQERLYFKLDRFGAEVKATSSINVCGATHIEYIFDRPFLVLMRVRGEREPYFAMWVDNTELMRKR